jgi:nickel-type superoxide dismutase maturation protease
MQEGAADIDRSPLSAVGLKEILAWTLSLRVRLRVQGQSMSPTLEDGDHVLFRPSTTASPGDIVVCRHPFRTDTRIIKRVLEQGPDGLILRGDNPAASTDSAQLGRIPWAHLQGCVTAKM